MAKIPDARRQVQEQVQSGQGFKARQQAPIQNTVTPAINRLAGNLIKYQQEEAQRADNSILDGLERDARDELNRATYDTENGYTKKKGIQAAEAESSYNDNYSKFLDKKVNELGSDRLKSKASSMIGNYKSRMKNSLTRYVSTENEKYLESQAISNLNSLTSDAGLNYNTSVVGESIARQKEVINGKFDDKGVLLIPGLSQTKGMSKEESALLTKETLSKTHLSVISRALGDEKEMWAQDYLSVIKDSGELTDRAYEKMNSMVKASVFRAETQAFTDDIIGKNLSLKESRKLAREIKNPKIRDDVTRRVTNRINEDRADEKFANREYFQDVGDDLMRDPEAFELTNAMNERLTFSEQNSLLSYKNKLLMAKKGSPVVKVNNWKIYDRLLNLPYEELQKEDLLKYQNDLMSGDLKKFMDMKKDAGSFSDAQTVNSYMSSMIKSQGFPDNEAGYQEEQFLRDSFINELNRYPKDVRNRPDTMSKVRKELMLVVKSPFWYRRSEKRYKKIYKEEKYIEPKERPKNLPQSSTYVDKVIDGTRVVGYEQFDSKTNVTIYYDFAGGPMYRLQPEKKKEKNK